MTMFWNSWLLTYWWGQRHWGVCGQNICYYVTAFLDSILFDTRHDRVLKKYNFDLLTPSLGLCRKEGLWTKIDTTLLHSWFPFIWYATWACSNNMNFDVLNPTKGSGVGRSACKIFATNICYSVAAFLILFNLICNMTTCWKCWIPTNWPHPQVGGGGGVCGKIFATMLLHSWFALIWYVTWQTRRIHIPEKGLFERNM